MRLDLEAHGMIVVKGDHPSIVHEHRRAPVDAIGDELLGRGDDGGLEQVVDGDRSIGVDLMAWTPTDWNPWALGVGDLLLISNR